MFELSEIAERCIWIVAYGTTKTAVRHARCYNENIIEEYSKTFSDLKFVENKNIPGWAGEKMLL